jgi:hypothetical protein
MAALIEILKTNDVTGHPHHIPESRLKLLSN